jgi:hypothetical protein
VGSHCQVGPHCQVPSKYCNHSMFCCMLSRTGWSLTSSQGFNCFAFWNVPTRPFCSRGMLREESPHNRFLQLCPPQETVTGRDCRTIVHTVSLLSLCLAHHKRHDRKTIGSIAFIEKDDSPIPTTITIVFTSLGYLS